MPKDYPGAFAALRAILAKHGRGMTVHAASSNRLVLSMSMLRIFPPLVAILPSANYSTVEWAFDAV